MCCALREGEEGNVEAADARLCCRRVHAHKTNDTEDSETAQDLDERVREADNERILHCVLKLIVVRGVVGEVAHAQSYTEENLTTGVLPDLAVGECFRTPGSPSVADAFGSIGQRNTTANEHNDHENRETHGKVHDSTSLADSTPNAQPDEEPGECAPSDGLGDHAGAGI